MDHGEALFRFLIFEGLVFLLLGGISVFQRFFAQPIDRIRLTQFGFLVAIVSLIWIAVDVGPKISLFAKRNVPVVEIVDTQFAAGKDAAATTRNHARHTVASAAETLVFPGQAARAETDRPQTTAKQPGLDGVSQSTVRLSPSESKTDATVETDAALAENGRFFALSPAVFWGIVGAVLFLPTICLLIRDVFAGMQWIRILRRSGAVPENVAAMFRKIKSESKRHVDLRLSRDIDVPVVFGFFRSTLLLPMSLCDSAQSGDSLRACLAHEWSHLRRGDLTTWNAVRLFGYLLWMQPFYWILRARLLVDQDFLADNDGVDELSDTASYAQVLLDLARHRVHTAPKNALGMAGHKSFFMRRIEMLFHQHDRLAQKANKKKMLLPAALLALLAIFGSSLRFGETIVAEEPEMPKTEQAAIPQATENAALPTGENREDLVEAETLERFKERIVQMGYQLLEEANASLQNEEISDMDFNTALLKGLWGIGFQYGFHEEKYLDEAEKYLDEVAATHMQNDLSSLGWWRTQIFDRRRMQIQEGDPSQCADAFRRLCEKYVSVKKEFSAYNDFLRSSFDLVVIRSGEALDPDSSLGLVKTAAEIFQPEDRDAADDGSFDNIVQGYLRRADAAGKPFRFFGLNPDETPFDIKDVQGKTVLVLFGYRFSDEQKQLLERLQNAMQDEAFELIVYVRHYEGPYSKTLADQKEEFHWFPGRIVFSKPLEPQMMWGMSTGPPHRDDNDLFEYYSPFSMRSLSHGNLSYDTLCIFLVDADGKTIRSDSRGLHSSLFTRLKELFPEKSAPLTVMETELQNREQVETDEQNRLRAFKESGTIRAELATLFDCMDMDSDLGFMLNHSFSYREYSLHRDRYFVLRDFPDLEDIPEELRFRILQRKFTTLRYEGVFQLENDPTLRPATVFQKLEDEIRDLRRKHPGHPYAYAIHSVRQSIIRLNEMEFLKKLPAAEQPEYARLVLKKYVNLVKEVPPDSERSVGSDYLIITPELIKVFQEIDQAHQTTLVRVLSRELAPLFERGENEYVRAYAEEMQKLATGNAAPSE